MGYFVMMGYFALGDIYAPTGPNYTGLSKIKIGSRAEKYIKNKWNQTNRNSIFYS